MTASVVGSRVKRLDAWAKVLGQAKFPADFSMPGQIYAVIVRSPYPHALIKQIKLAKARHLPGVIDIATGWDVPNNCHGVLFRDQPVLVTDRVRMAGDPVVAVAAESLSIARQAASLVDVDYTVLPPLLDVETALQAKAPPLHTTVHGPSNQLFHQRICKGDLQEGWAQSAVIVVQEYQTQMVEHAFLQPEAALAYLDENSRVVVQVATQYPHYDRGEIANALGLKLNQVQVKTKHVGGAFGGREDISIQLVAALLAWRTGRPVKMVNTRQEAFYTHCKRHPMRLSYKTGAGEDGKLKAMEATIVADAGAYASWSPNIVRKAAVHATGPYEIPHVKIDSYAVLTNNPWTGAMRGFGAAQPVFAYESQMDLLAKGLGISPWEIRARNLLQAGSQTATGQTLTGSVGLEDCLKMVQASYKGVNR